MNVGKLYQINKYFWLLFPSKENATVDVAVPAAAAAAYLSNRFNCIVSYIKPNSIFCLLEREGNFLKVLSNDGDIGWILYPESESWAKDCIEEVKQ